MMLIIMIMLVMAMIILLIIVIVFLLIIFIVLVIRVLDIHIVLLIEKGASANKIVAYSRFTGGTGCTSGSRVSTCEGFDHPIGSAQWMGYFLFEPVVLNWSIKDWYVLSCLWESAYKRSLAAYRKE